MRKRESAAGHDLNPTDVAVAALRRALGDALAAVRGQAAAALGRVGNTAVGAADALAELLQDADDKTPEDIEFKVRTSGSAVCLHSKTR